MTPRGNSTAAMASAIEMDMTPAYGLGYRFPVVTMFPIAAYPGPRSSSMRSTGSSLGKLVQAACQTIVSSTCA